jgi:AraC family transcriptional regulator
VIEHWLALRSIRVGQRRRPICLRASLWLIVIVGMATVAAPRNVDKQVQVIECPGYQRDHCFDLSYSPGARYVRSPSLLRGRMSQKGAFGNVLGEAFRVRHAPVLVSRTLRRSLLAVTHVRRDLATDEPTASIPEEDSFLINVVRCDTFNHNIWLGGKHIETKPFPKGSTSLFDLKRDPVAVVNGTIDGVMFYLPQAALDDFTDDIGAARIPSLFFEHGAAFEDPIMKGLTEIACSVIEHSDEANTLFLDHVALAFRAHVAGRYGRLLISRGQVCGGLVPWQKRRAEELLLSKIDGDVALAEVARECGLSLSYFTRSFKQSTGVPPYRWLMQQRIGRAKELLGSSKLSLAEIALICGFANQSHLTRVFQALVGASPGAWRRQRRH